MNIGRYERIDTDWDRLIEDVRKTPHVTKFEPDRTTSWQRIEFGDFPWNQVVPYPSALRVANNDDAIIKYLNLKRADLGLKPFDKDTTRVQPGSYYAAYGKIIKISVGVYTDIQQLAVVSGYGWRIVPDESDAPPLYLRGENVLCRAGLHNYPKGEPELMDYIRKEEGRTIFDAFFGYLGMSDATQVGAKRCTRCGKRKFFKRKGTYPINSDRWGRTTEEEYKRVIRLPKVSL